ncbi:MAG: response regulator transcription factor [Acidimicrobiia bacterium]
MTAIDGHHLAEDHVDHERCVLVVDDDPVLRKVVRAVLEADGFRVIEAPDGFAGLAVAAAERPPVIILDVMMPGIDGVEVCRRLDHRASKVLMLTALGDAATEEASLAAGARAYLTKPFSSMQLLDSVEALLGS